MCSPYEITRPARRPLWSYTAFRVAYRLTAWTLLLIVSWAPIVALLWLLWLVLA